MMQLDSQITRSFHDEHLNTIALLERIDAELAKHRLDAVPDTADNEMNKLLGDICVLVDTELNTHFGFEEDSLFPLLTAAGDGFIAGLLTEEHRTILPLGERLREIAQGAKAGGFNQESWSEFRQLGMEITERLISHIQKEEMGLLPMLDNLIDEDKDIELSDSYAMLR